MKSTHILVLDKAETSGRKVSPDLEDAGSKLMRASTALDKAIQILIKDYPKLAILANKLPMLNGQHPYLRIKQAAYLYKRL